VLIGENVRDSAALNSQFIARVREHGVLQPITAGRFTAGCEITRSPVGVDGLDDHC
jgi:ParB family chromosome partitioning protein